MCSGPRPPSVIAGPQGEGGRGGKGNLHFFGNGGKRRRRGGGVTSWPPCLIGSIRSSVAGPPLVKEEGGGMKLENDSSSSLSLLVPMGYPPPAAGPLGYFPFPAPSTTQGGGPPLVSSPLNDFPLSGVLEGALLISLFTSLPPPLPFLSTVWRPGAGRGGKR